MRAVFGSDSRRLSLKVLQVDPSLFTAPYDAALTRGLEMSFVESIWATRALRDGEEDLLAGTAHRFFYPLTDGPRRRTGRSWKILKGIEHALGLARLKTLAAAHDVDVVHFQWGLVPQLDRRAVVSLGRRWPVIFTVHDVEPLNGARGGAQVAGFDRMLNAADALIVHTDAGKRALTARGISAEKINVVPHGLLPLPPAQPEARDSNRWRIVLFGRIQAYKGADVAVEAMGRLSPDDRANIELVIAGEPLIDIRPIEQRLAELDLGSAVDLRLRRLDEREMASLLRSADAFVFPYRTIEASGVLHLVGDLERWIIASDVGTFRTLLESSPGAGELVAAGDPDALAAAIKRSVGRLPTESPAADVLGWKEIGSITRGIYERVITGR